MGQGHGICVLSPFQRPGLNRTQGFRKSNTPDPVTVPTLTAFSQLRLRKLQNLAAAGAGKREG
jgi:hypothetical protein